MAKHDLREFLAEQNPHGAVHFRNVDVDTINSSEPKVDAQGTRYAREGELGADRYETAKSQSHGEFDVVWIYECFIRNGGQDWHFWYADQKLLSDPVPVVAAYPEQQGDRPLVIGIGSLESHKTDPLSTVMSLQPLQQEANDITNLRLDNIKQNMSPVTKVRRGKNVNLTQVQNRGPDSVLMLEDLEDVEWDRPPDVSSAAYAEMDRLNADFDDLAGAFSGSSVNTNRNLNETVGGMRMLQSGAQSVAEFDLRVWNETWVEPVLRQLIKLEEMYESDERIMAIAGQNAKLYERFGMNEFTDKMLAEEVTVRVNAGIGSTDPMQRIERIAYAAQSLATIIPPEELMARAKADPFIEEIMGALGYKNSVDRFFNPAEEADGRIQQMQQMIQQLQKELEDKRGEWNNKKEVAQIQAGADLAEQQLENEGKMMEMREQARVDMQKMPVEKFFDAATQSLMSKQQHEQNLEMEKARPKPEAKGPSNQ